MRIVVACFTDVRSGGGGATKARLVARTLRQRGHDVTLLSKVDPPGQPGWGECDSVPVLFHRAPAGRAWRTPMLVQERVVTTFLRDGLARPDAVVGVSHLYVNAARRAWPGVRTVFLLPGLLWQCLPNLHERASVLSRLNHWLIARSERRALRRSDVTLVPSLSMREDVLRFARAPLRVEICPNGVDVPADPPPAPRAQTRGRFDTPPQALVALAAGSLDRNKNVQALLRALALCPDERLVLWIAGQGPLEQALWAQASRDRLDGRVRFLGYQRPMTDIYAAADLLVHAALYECFANVFLEAMASGLPVLGPRNDRPGVVSSLHEIIDDGVQGWLCDPRRPEELARRLAWCLDNRRGLPDAGQAARQRALARYSWERFVDRVEQALDPGHHAG